MKIGGRVACMAILVMAVSPLPGLAGDMVLKGGQVTVKVAPDVAKDEDKARAITDYKVMERLQTELGHQMGGMPASAHGTIVITGFRLRSGGSAFFVGGMAGSDVIEAEITIKDKGKQLHYFNIESDVRAGGKRNPPTRRVKKLVREFGDKLARKMRRGTVRMPQNIEIHMR